MNTEITAHYSSKAFKALVQNRIINLLNDNILDRIWDKDHTVWHPNPNEISNRLGWITSPETMMLEVGTITSFVKEVILDDFSHVVLLGMGGSSLAPEVFKNTFGVKDGYLELTVLDTTDPTAILAITKSLEIDKTLFIIATKSGGTIETLSLLKYFYSLAKYKSGAKKAGKQFVAITDPGSNLEKTALELGFRNIFLNDPNIGGRYSALSFFGLVPAALIGVDIEKILDAAQKMKTELFTNKTKKNPGIFLGTFLGEAAKLKKDKLFLNNSPPIMSFGDWIEQLIAESTGKSGVGILPIVGQSINKRYSFPEDHVFVSIELGNNGYAETLQQEEIRNIPQFIIKLENEYDLGGQFYLWEFATVIAGAILNIQPFDQPDVESAKILAKEVISNFKETGSLPTIKSSPFEIKELVIFLKNIEKNDYISIHAYAPPNPPTNKILNQLRQKISSKYNVAATIGYGPRFLHSTGQLHKGDSGNGHFIQLISKPPEDINIPDNYESADSSFSFGDLKVSQAIGDAEALKAKGRKVITFEIAEDQISELLSWAKEL